MKKGFCAREGSNSKHVIDLLQFQTVIRLKPSNGNMLAVLSAFLNEATKKHPCSLLVVNLL